MLCRFDVQQKDVKVRSGCMLVDGVSACFSRGATESSGDGSRPEAAD